MPAEVHFPPMNSLVLKADEGRALNWALQFHYALRGDTINYEIPRMPDFVATIRAKAEQGREMTLMWAAGEKTKSLGHLVTMLSDMSYTLGIAHHIKASLHIETEFNPAYWKNTCEELAQRIIAAELHSLQTEAH